MSDDAFTILLVEDDDATRTFLADNLTADGYELLVTASIGEGLRLLEHQFPDLVVVDVGLPDGSGLELVRAVREADGATSRLDPATPMLVLSGRAGELDRLRGFERGADDYVVKPFSYAELRSRVAALLRRAQGRRVAGRLRVGGLLIDPPSRQVTLHGEVLALSQKEFSLLRVLASEPTRVWTKAELLRMVWGHHMTGTTRTLDSHICRLRQKLGVGGERWVTNVWGVGYRLIEPRADDAAREAPREVGAARAAVGVARVAAAGPAIVAGVAR
jgi:DNA-binding response OmpR family regulator